MPSTYFRKDLLLVGKSYWKYRIPGMYSACFFENGQEKFFFNNINIAHQFNVAPNSFINYSYWMWILKKLLDPLHYFKK